MMPAAHAALQSAAEWVRIDAVIADFAAVELERTFAADRATIEALIASLDARIATAPASELVALIGASQKARYFRRNLIRTLGKMAGDMDPEPSGGEAATTAPDLSRARAQATKLRQPAEPEGL